MAGERKGVTSVPKTGKVQPLSSSSKVANVSGNASIAKKPVKK